MDQQAGDSFMVEVAPEGRPTVGYISPRRRGRPSRTLNLYLKRVSTLAKRTI